MRPLMECQYILIRCNGIQKLLECHLRNSMKIMQFYTPLSIFIWALMNMRSFSKQYIFEEVGNSIKLA